MPQDRNLDANYSKYKDVLVALKSQFKAIYGNDIKIEISDEVSSMGFSPKDKKIIWGVSFVEFLLDKFPDLGMDAVLFCALHEGMHYVDYLDNPKLYLDNMYSDEFGSIPYYADVFTAEYFVTRASLLGGYSREKINKFMYSKIFNFYNCLDDIWVDRNVIERFHRFGSGKTIVSDINKILFDACVDPDTLSIDTSFMPVHDQLGFFPLIYAFISRTGLPDQKFKVSKSVSSRLNQILKKILKITQTEHNAESRFKVYGEEFLPYFKELLFMFLDEQIESIDYQGKNQDEVADQNQNISTSDEESEDQNEPDLEDENSSESLGNQKHDSSTENQDQEQTEEKGKDQMQSGDEGKDQEQSGDEFKDQKQDQTEEKGKDQQQDQKQSGDGVKDQEQSGDGRLSSSKRPQSLDDIFGDNQLNHPQVSKEELLEALEGDPMENAAQHSNQRILDALKSISKDDALNQFTEEEINKARELYYQILDEIRPVTDDYAEKLRSSLEGLSSDINIHTEFANSGALDIPQLVKKLPGIFIGEFSGEIPPIYRKDVESVDPNKIPSIHVEFVVDTSGSMFDLMDEVKKFMICLSRLFIAYQDFLVDKDDLKFGMVVYDTFATRVMPVEGANLHIHEQFIASLPFLSPGGNNNEPEAFSLLNDSDKDIKILFWMTDGATDSWDECEQYIQPLIDSGWIVIGIGLDSMLRFSGWDNLFKNFDSVTDYIELLRIVYQEIINNI